MTVTKQKTYNLGEQVISFKIALEKIKEIHALAFKILKDK